MILVLVVELKGVCQERDVKAGKRAEMSWAESEQSRKLSIKGEITATRGGRVGSRERSSKTA
jgi:hypothetical protein